MKEIEKMKTDKKEGPAIDTLKNKLKKQEHY